jgi:hypothetical protein
MMALIILLVTGAGLYYWYAARKTVVLPDPRQEYLATLLLVGTSAFSDRNSALYQATIKEILCLMSKECWERAEIEWRLRQALLMAKEDSTPETFEKVNSVGENIARWTVHSPKALPWEAGPYIKLLAQRHQNSRPEKLLLSA